MKRFHLAPLLALAILASSLPARAAGWVSLGVGGIGIGDPHQDPSPGSTTDDRAGGFAGYAALTAGNIGLVRLRATGFAYTSNEAIERAVLVGTRTGRNSAVLLGYSLLEDVSETEKYTNGFVAELLYAPRGRGFFSGELSLIGNINGDHSFVGALAGLRFGNTGTAPAPKSKPAPR